MGDLHGPRIEPISPALKGRFFTSEPPRNPWRRNILRRDTKPCQEQEREMWVRRDGDEAGNALMDVPRAILVGLSMTAVTCPTNGF